MNYTHDGQSKIINLLTNLWIVSSPINLTHSEIQMVAEADQSFPFLVTHRYNYYQTCSSNVPKSLVGSSESFGAVDSSVNAT